jgi:acyl-CoA thioesterase FadM
MSHYTSFVRIPALVLRQILAPLPLIGALEEDVLQLRVWPSGIDFNLHMNNARYLSEMDYARVRLLARGGVLKPILKARWAPVVGAVWITYRRSLPLWATYTLTTRLVGWDNRWFYMEQTFTAKEGLIAVGWVKGALIDTKGTIRPQQVMEMVQAGIVSPELPEAIQTLNELTREKLQAAG